VANEEDTELQIYLPIDSPETIDSAFIFRLGAAYLELIAHVAREQGRELAFRGLRLGDGSTRAYVTPDDPRTAQEAAEEAAPYVSGETEAPPSIEPYARRVSCILQDGLPPAVMADVIIGPWSRPLATRPPEDRSLSTDTLSVRAKVLRVGGIRPAVRVETTSEDGAFTLQITPPDAPKLGARLYQDIDLVATVRRDPEWKIVGGTLDSWEPLEEGSGVEAWREWFRRSCPEWEDVEDVNRALGRTDDESDNPDGRH
jgi:hypothetical protein